MIDLSTVYRCPVTGRFYDPLRCRRDLFARSGDAVNQWIAENDQGKLVALARAVFGLPDVDPVTGEGFLDAAVLEVLDKFTEYLAGKGGTAQNSPTSVPCSQCP